MSSRITASRTDPDHMFALSSSPSPFLVDEGTGCWLWAKNALSDLGYGIVWDGTKKHYAHRFYFEQTFGSNPTGTDLHHRCEVKHCVNPFHLEVLTRKEHMARHEWTHCKSGHEFTPENTYVWEGNGKRQCKTCRRKRKRVAA